MKNLAAHLSQTLVYYSKNMVTALGVIKMKPKSGEYRYTAVKKKKIYNSVSVTESTLNRIGQLL